MKYTVLALLLPLATVAQYPDTLLGSLPTGQNPVDVCISPDGTKAYAAVQFGFAAVIDINGYSDFSYAGMVTIDGEPATLECDPTGEHLYVADSENNQLHIIDTSQLSVVKTIDIQPNPTDMVLVSTENRIFLSHLNGMITVIDTETQEVSGVFWAGEQLHSLSVTPDMSTVFAADNGSPDEAVINASTGVLSHFSSGMDSYCSSVSGTGDKLFLSCPAWNILGVVDIASLTLQETVSCSTDAPQHMAALPVLPYIYGTCPDQNELLVINTDDAVVEGSIPLPGTPVSIAAHPDGERLFVVCFGDNKLKVIGFDPSGSIPDQHQNSFEMTAVCSPSPEPTLKITGENGTAVSLHGCDLSGRTVVSTQLVIGNETEQFTLRNLPAGIILLTGRCGEQVSHARVVVLAE